MAKLIYSAIASADGYIEDPGGSIDWGMPDEELLGFINELEQPAPTCTGADVRGDALLGNGPHDGPATFVPGIHRHLAGSREDRVPKTLASVSSARTRVEPAFEPGLVRQLKSAAEHDMRVRGADLAGQAIKAGLADEVRLFLVPVVVGGG